MALKDIKAANNAKTELAQAISPTDNSFIVNDASVFPDAPFRVTIDSEIMEVGAINKSTNTFSEVTRGVENTIATDHSRGASVENRWTAGTLQIILNNVQILEEQCAAAYTEFTGHHHDKDYAPLNHVGATGDAHGLATETNHGFMSAQDKKDLNMKIDRPSSATTGNIPVFDSKYKLKDSGKNVFNISSRDRYIFTRSYDEEAPANGDSKIKSIDLNSYNYENGVVTIKSESVSVFIWCDFKTNNAYYIRGTEATGSNYYYVDAGMFNDYLEVRLTSYSSRSNAYVKIYLNETGRIKLELYADYEQTRRAKFTINGEVW